MKDEKNTHSNVSTASLEDPERRRILRAIALGAGLTVGHAKFSWAADALHSDADRRLDAVLRAQVRHIVVIYAENRSVANLFGHFSGMHASFALDASKHARQRDRDGTLLPRLPPIWQGLVPHAQEIAGKRYQITQSEITHLPNAPFQLCDAQGLPLPAGVITRDLWHRFYQNQMQINAGRNDQFVAWSDSGALVMGHYGKVVEHSRLWQLARQYTFCNNFFMAAFGGSFLNHMFLVSAQPPFYPNIHTSPAQNEVSILEEDDPTGTRLKCAADSPTSALDGPPKFERDGKFTPDGYGVNTLNPPYQPSGVPPSPGGDSAYADPTHPSVLPPQYALTIGERLSEKGIDWAWYGGAWQDASHDRNRINQRPYCFQCHHQPFNYFARYAPGTQARRDHLRDAGVGNDPSTHPLMATIDAGTLPAVTFYKPQGSLSLHAGYTDIASGDHHIANLIDHIRQGPQWSHTVIIMTFDENGGWWDPVAPPKGDRWGPGSRIPALVIAPFAKQGYVDPNLYDTTSILRFISRVHGLPPLPGVVARDQALVRQGTAPLGDLTHALALI